MAERYLKESEPLMNAIGACAAMTLGDELVRHFHELKDEHFVTHLVPAMRIVAQAGHNGCDKLVTIHDETSAPREAV